MKFFDTYIFLCNKIPNFTVFLYFYHIFYFLKILDLFYDKLIENNAFQIHANVYTLKTKHYMKY